MRPEYPLRRTIHHMSIALRTSRWHAVAAIRFHGRGHCDAVTRPRHPTTSRSCSPLELVHMSTSTLCCHWQPAHRHALHYLASTAQLHHQHYHHRVPLRTGSSRDIPRRSCAPTRHPRPPALLRGIRAHQHLLCGARPSSRRREARTLPVPHLRNGHVVESMSGPLGHATRYTRRNVILRRRDGLISCTTRIAPHDRPGSEARRQSAGDERERKRQTDHMPLSLACLRRFGDYTTYTSNRARHRRA